MTKSNKTLSIMIGFSINMFDLTIRLCSLMRVAKSLGTFFQSSLQTRLKALNLNDQMVLQCRWVQVRIQSVYRTCCRHVLSSRDFRNLLINHYSFNAIHFIDEFHGRTSTDEEILQSLLKIVKNAELGMIQFFIYVGKVDIINQSVTITILVMSNSLLLGWDKT